MSVFYPSLRVRLVNGGNVAPEFLDLVGLEGVIKRRYAGIGPWDWVVDVSSEREEIVVCESHMEPILPPDLLADEDINALYEPQITEADIPSEVWQR